MNSKTKTLTQTALMSALMCIIGPVTIPLPFSMVPLSLISVVIFLSVYIIGTKQAVFSCVIYLLIGMAGLPVFSSFTGGAGKLFGPTGGYLISYVLIALVSGCFIQKKATNKIYCFIGMSLGTLVCYLVGTLWLSYQANLSIEAALISGTVPFIAGDILKIIIVLILAPKLQKRLKRAAV